MLGAEKLDVMLSKSEMRTLMLKRRKAYVETLGEETRENISLHLVQRLMDYFIFPMDCVVGSYFPLTEEQNVRLLNFSLKGDGLDVGYPRVGPEGLLTYHLVSSPQELIVGKYGIYEPSEQAPQISPDLFIVPLVAFDDRCHRLGYGQGNFDRTLKKAREAKKVLAIGVAYDMQKVDYIANESFDQPMDYVVTESQIYKAEKK
ncbi:MAG: 5-formyltetrahydrofolate cyclo-ligase [Alphaproteobacteria bacterium]|nr:5-formyltetrahydrofolate cyclo-ligase [Alphaproteobacteria bacterium]